MAADEKSHDVVQNRSHLANGTLMPLVVNARDICISINLFSILILH